MVTWEHRTRALHTRAHGETRLGLCALSRAEVHCYGACESTEETGLTSQAQSITVPTTGGWEGRSPRLYLREPRVSSSAASAGPRSRSAQLERPQETWTARGTRCLRPAGPRTPLPRRWPACPAAQGEGVWTKRLTPGGVSPCYVRTCYPADASMRTTYIKHFLWKIYMCSQGHPENPLNVASNRNFLYPTAPFTSPRGGLSGEHRRAAERTRPARPPIRGRPVRPGAHRIRAGIKNKMERASTDWGRGVLPLTRTYTCDFWLKTYCL